MEEPVPGTSTKPVDIIMDEDQSSESSMGAPASDQQSTSSENFIRYWPAAYILQAYSPHHLQAFEYFNGYNVSERSKFIVESGEGGYHPMESSDSDYPLQPFIHWFQEETTKGILRTIVPESNQYADARDTQMSITFGSNGFCNLLMHLQLSLRKECHEKDRHCSRLLWPTAPTAIPVITFFGGGVFGSINTMEGTKQCIDLENEELPCLTALQIPKVEGFTLQPFVVSFKQNESLDGMLRMGLFQDILGITKENQKDLKGIVFFHHFSPLYKQSSLKSPIVKYLLMFLQANRHVAMAGGVSDYLLNNGPFDGEVVATGFLVIGKDENLRVACTILEEPGLPMENIDKLKHLTAQILPKSEGQMVSSFGFIFSSLQRGMAMYGSPGMEASYLAQLFPHTHLIGGHTGRQFCSEILNTAGKEVIEASNATVCIVISYKHPLPN